MRDGRSKCFLSSHDFLLGCLKLRIHKHENSQTVYVFIHSHHKGTILCPQGVTGLLVQDGTFYGRCLRVRDHDKFYSQHNSTFEERPLYMEGVAVQKTQKKTPCWWWSSLIQSTIQAFKSIQCFKSDEFIMVQFSFCLCTCPFIPRAGPVNSAVCRAWNLLGAVALPPYCPSYYWAETYQHPGTFWKWCPSFCHSSWLNIHISSSLLTEIPQLF